jgi:hypothetical protein
MNESLLSLLTEDDNDDIFFELCAQRISGKSFFQTEPRRLRKNGGIGAVRKAMRPFLNDLRKVESLDAYFIIALDNDRAPDHEQTHQRLPRLAKADHKKACRVCEIRRAIEEVWGGNPDKWPAKGAIAVPVQMLESWILHTFEHADDEALPIFSRKTQARAVEYHNGNPPDQLKDLCDARRDGRDKAEFTLEVASAMDLETVASRSASFNAFNEQVAAWASGPEDRGT